MNRAELNIRTDLFRVAKTAFNIKKQFEYEIAQEFIEKAKLELDRIPVESATLKNDLVSYQAEMNTIQNDPLKRIWWGEKIITISTRLGIV